MKINTDNASDSIKEARPNLKPNTIKQYETHLNKLKKIFETDNWDFLSDPEKVADKLKDKAYTSRRNTYNAVIVLLMALNHKEVYTELIEKYDKMRNELNAKYDEEMSSGKISDKQSKNFAEYEEVESMIKKMENQIKEQGLKKKTDLTGKERELLMVYTIYSMLIRIPTRNDMAGQILLNGKKAYNKLSEEDKKSNNYLVKEKNKMFGVYNEYKTSKKYGEKRIDIPKDLEKIINMYIRKTNKKSGDVLFVSSTGNALSRNMISQLLMRTSKRYMNKSVSTTLMRKIVASHHFGADSEFGKLKKKQEELAEKMGHSTDVMDKVYIKEKE